MKPEDVIGSWVSNETISAEGKRSKRGPLKSKLDIDADGTAVLKTGFLKSKDTWSIKGDTLVLHNIGFDIDMGTLVLTDEGMNLTTTAGVICVYTRA